MGDRYVLGHRAVTLAGGRGYGQSMTTAGAVDVVELIGNPRLGSRTRTLADATVAALAAGGGIPVGAVRVLELGEIVGVSFGAEPASGSGAVADPFGAVRAARLLVVATPTYKGTYTGLLKVFLDQFGHRELAGTVAVPVAIAVSAAYRDSVGAALTALLIELGASVPAPPLALLESQLTALDDSAAQWAAQHGGAIVEALTASAVRA